MVNHKYFASDVEIKNIVDVLKLNKYISLESELYSAPKNWLIDNGYEIYIKKKQIKKLKLCI